MLKVDKETLADMEEGYPGIIKQIMNIENNTIPACPYCGSDNTASVQGGCIGRTINIFSATTKFRLEANIPNSLGAYFCNFCGKYFGNRLIYNFTGGKNKKQAVYEINYEDVCVCWDWEVKNEEMFYSREE